jgi:DNA (cytosine-5)-methyltransferase 1
MDLGFRAAGYDVVCAIEIEQWACDTLRLNHRGMHVMGPPTHPGDIKQVTPKLIQAFCGSSSAEFDVVTGGPPCQPFSQASTQRFLKSDPRFKRRGFEDDLKGTLLFDFVRLVTSLRPRVFVLENVPGLLSVDGGVQFELALTTLKGHGYSISEPAVLDAANYGVPQHRNRLIIWGSLKVDRPSLPTPTHGPANGLFLKPYTTVAHALVNMPQSLPNHVTRDHQDESIVRYRNLKFGERDKLGRTDRLNVFRPSKTVIAGGMHGGGRSHLHPFIARTLSVRESARLQTFPDDYVFEGSIARQFTQVGNAVPPLLAEHLARHIKLIEFGENVKGELHYGKYLNLSEDVTSLANTLLRESRKQKLEWIYSDSLTGPVPQSSALIKPPNEKSERVNI